MISVIIPYWNAEQWIGRCADSLKDQNAEIIFVNDNSTDDSEQILKDKGFTSISNTHLQGVSGARNTGIENAHGKWITFLDADDVMLPYACELYEQATKHADIIQFNHLRYYAELDKTVCKYRNNGGDYSLGNLPLCWCMVWNKLYKAELIQDIRFNETMWYGEDELFNLECLARSNKIQCFEASTIKRHFENKQSLSHIKGIDELLIQVKELERFLIRNTDPIVRKATMELLSEHWRSGTYEKIFCTPPVLG